MQLLAAKITKVKEATFKKEGASPTKMLTYLTNMVEVA